MLEFLPEANRVVLVRLSPAMTGVDLHDRRQTILRSAFDYREYNLGVYGIALPMIKPWSSRPAVIDVVLEFFDATTKCIDTLGPGPEQTGEVAEPKSQLPDLAAILLACFQERLDWLRRYVILQVVP
jgi:nuclear pore complex protein Nup133